MLIIEMTASNQYEQDLPNSVRVSFHTGAHQCQRERKQIEGYRVDNLIVIRLY
jgi:hypothetical protein